MRSQITHQRALNSEAWRRRNVRASTVIGLVLCAFGGLAVQFNLSDSHVREGGDGRSPGAEALRNESGWAEPAAALAASPAQATPEAELYLFDGLYGGGFEVSSFQPGVADCPAYGEGFWLEASPEFGWRFEELYPGGPPSAGILEVARVRFWGRLSSLGSYGHLGSYARQVTVDEVLYMAAWVGCGGATPAPAPPLPDLYVDSLTWTVPGWNGNCQPQGSGPLLRVCVINRGKADAGSFQVTAPLAAEWSVSGLAEGERRCLVPREASPAGSVAVDSADVVTESVEYNNSEPVPDTVPTPAPTCVAPPSPTPEKPDLAFVSAGYRMTNYLGPCVPELRELVVSYCLENRGGLAAGPFEVVGVTEPGATPSARWVATDLQVGEILCPQPEYVFGSLIADPSDVVDESDESNNEYRLPMPTAPPTCEPRWLYPSPTPSHVVPTDTPSTPTTETPMSPTPSPTATGTGGALAFQIFAPRVLVDRDSD